MTSFLITGGTGTFGRAFVHRLLTQNLSDRVCIFSRSEHVQAQMRDQFNNDSRLRWFIGDVRDRDRLRRAMEGIDVVVHAAALKRIEVGHYNTEEMIKTNVLGASNVVNAVQDAGVARAVALSTDKAYHPISTYGQTKALAERVFMNANDQVPADGPMFRVTRYGNVWWSQGSVGPLWHSMICRGAKTVPVTDPTCTRFFMWQHEAVDLVLDALYDDSGETLFVPTLPAYDLESLAQAFGAEMHVKGLPDYEKQHERMNDEQCSATARRMSVQELREVINRTIRPLGVPSYAAA